MKRKDGKKRNHPGNVKNLKPPWRKGQSGNPAGRKNGGAYLTELLNSLLCGELTEAKIRKISNDKSLSIAKRAAAYQCLELIERPDMAEFAALINGLEDLEQLRARGVDTSQIRKLKARTFTTEGNTEKTCEIELHNRAGDAFDRVCDRTNGRPRQALEVSGDADSELRTADARRNAADAILDRCRQLMSKPG